jgi:CDP-glycerol glycerophosphotransferase (TagB/SpsB family)
LYVPEGKYEGVGLVEIFDASSAIIGDVSSVMLEAILTEKPLIFAYGNGDHQQSDEEYTAITDIVAASNKLTSTAAATRLDYIMRGALAGGTNHTVWQKAINRTFFHADGTSVAAIEAFVRSLF